MQIDGIPDGGPTQFVPRLLYRCDDALNNEVKRSALLDGNAMTECRLQRMSSSGMCIVYRACAESPLAHSLRFILQCPVVIEGDAVRQQSRLDPPLFLLHDVPSLVRQVLLLPWGHVDVG